MNSKSRKKSRTISSILQPILGTDNYFKGWLMTEYLRERYERYSWKVKTWHPAMKGIDMLAVKDEPLIVNESEHYTGHVRVLEVLNWSITSYLPVSRVKRIIKNLNIEADKKKKLYRGYFIEKGLHYTHASIIDPFILTFLKEEIVTLQECEIDLEHPGNLYFWIKKKRLEYEKLYGDLKTESS